MSEVIFGTAGGIRDGKQAQGFAPSGPSSGYLPASMVDVRLDFKSLAAVGLHAGFGRDRGVRGRHVHARHGAERGHVLPQRILREVRAVPRGFAEDGGYSDRMDAGQGNARGFATGGRTCRKP